MEVRAVSALHGIHQTGLDPACATEPAPDPTGTVPAGPGHGLFLSLPTLPGTAGRGRGIPGGVHAHERGRVVPSDGKAVTVVAGAKLGTAID